MNEINPILRALLERRGMLGEDEIAEFLSEKPRKTYDPFLLLNMEAGVDLILSAASRGKGICVYGDYDADGVTSVCLLMQVLSHLTENASCYVPSRFDEGYGLNKAAIDTIKDGGADVIITVDCGSSSVEEVRHANAIGVETVVTDHHSISGAVAGGVVINPKQPGCGYPFKQLAGVGVAFKLAQGLQKKAGLPASLLSSVLDLVAVGTIGDIVPLTDENRTIVKYGMRELNRLRRKGMAGLASAAGLKAGAITSENVAYVIAPHINAAGRMLSAGAAVDLLVSVDDDAVRENATKLVECNASRKRIQEGMYRQCVEMVDESFAEDKCIVICPPGAHEGVAGIVAGKIKERYNRPAIIVTRSGDSCKGTGRSIDGVNLHELLGGFGHLFSRFGGHSAACGFLMDAGNLEELMRGLKRRMEELCSVNPGILDEVCDYDMEIAGRDVTVGLGEEIERLAPFGNGNRKPVFRVNGVVVRNAALMGDGGRHMRFTGECADGAALNCVLFNKAAECGGTGNSGRTADLLGTVDLSVWNGSRRVQFMVDRMMSMGSSDDND